MSATSKSLNSLGKDLKKKKPRAKITNLGIATITRKIISYVKIESVSFFIRISDKNEEQAT